jgi:phosphopentomutase
MEKTILEAQRDFSGLCFVNLVEFDSEYGHRRNPQGYGQCIEEFDGQLKELLEVLNDDDLLIITADHGNDPTYKGSDHTREQVPNICYSKSFKNGKLLSTRSSFADLGRTIIANFSLEKEGQIGEIIEELLK